MKPGHFAATLIQRGKTRPRDAASAHQCRTPQSVPAMARRIHHCRLRRTAASGGRRDKAALSSGCKPQPGNRSRRKQPEQAWRGKPNPALLLVGWRPCADSGRSHAALGAAARVNAHRALGRKNRHQACEAPAVRSSSGYQPEAENTERRPPRSLPKSRATEALSRSNTLLYPANGEGQASRTVGPAASDDLRSRRRAIECCCPPSPSIWCTTRQVTTIPMLLLRHSYFKEGSSARFRGEERALMARSPQPR
jgi:hypothetical protein